MDCACYGFLYGIGCNDYCWKHSQFPMLILTYIGFLKLYVHNKVFKDNSLKLSGNGYTEQSLHNAMLGIHRESYPLDRVISEVEQYACYKGTVYNGTAGKLSFGSQNMTVLYSIMSMVIKELPYTYIHKKKIICILRSVMIISLILSWANKIGGAKVKDLQGKRDLAILKQQVTPSTVMILSFWTDRPGQTM